MYKTYRYTLVFAALLVSLLMGTAKAQETIFNVPSPDVLDRGKFYLETDQYFRPWKTSSGHAAFGLLRGVYGVGYNIETGFNAGPFDYLYTNRPFLDATVKWRPVLHEFGEGDAKGAVGLIVGDNLGVGLRHDVAGHIRNLVYGSGFVTIPGTKTRFSGGLYHATRDVFTKNSRVGGQVTFEQPIPGIDGLTVAADWFSGTGAAFTPGLIWNKDRTFIYAGYGFANTGRKDDLITLEFGYMLK